MPYTAAALIAYVTNQTSETVIWAAIAFVVARLCFFAVLYCECSSLAIAGFRCGFRRHHHALLYQPDPSPHLTS